MAFGHGKNGVFKITDSGGTLRDISAFCNQVDYPVKVDQAKTTVFGKVANTYLAGLKDRTIKVSGVFDPALDGYLRGILAFGSTRAYEYGPFGSTTGNPKYTGGCNLSDYSGPKAGVDGVVTFDASFQVSDDDASTTY